MIDFAPFSVRVPATSANLGPGFDCLGVALRLHLTVRCSPSERRELVLEGEGHEYLPRDGRNLVARALQLGGAFDSVPACRIEVRNEVPLARGLGSSSAAAVAGLALGAILRTRIGRESGPTSRGRVAGSAGSHRPTEANATDEIDRIVLLELANELEGHPDNVAPAVHGDFVISGQVAGRGGRTQVRAVRERWPEELRFLTIVPELRVRTDEARRALPSSVPFATAVENSGRLARLLGALHQKRFDLLSESLHDELHEPYRLPLGKGLVDALVALRSHPVSRGAYLSGSGPTLIALTEEAPGSSAVESLARAAEEALAAKDVRVRSHLLEVDREGLVVSG